MELISSSNTITSKVPKLIETDKHFIMNTQVYDKLTLKPIPMKFFTFSLSSAMYNFSILNNSVIDCSGETTDLLQNSCQKIGNYKNIIKDKYNANVFYLISRYSIHQAICRIIESNNNYTIDKIIYSTNMLSRTYTDFTILYETDDDFVLWVKGNSYGGWTTSTLVDLIIKVNKNSLSAKTFFSEEITTSTYYMEHSENIGYILRVSYSSGFRIFKLDTSSNQYSAVSTYANISNSNNLGSNPVKINDYYYFLSTKYDASIGYRYVFVKLKLDTTNDIMSYEIIEISNYDNYKMNSSTSVPTSLGFSYEIRHQLQTFKQNGSTYLSCTIYGPETYMSNTWQHKHVLFKITDDIIEIKQIIPLTDGCKGVLFVDEDYKKPVFVMTNSYLFYLFDSTKEKFINTFMKGGLYKVVGFDSAGRFITQTKDDTIEMLTETNACILKADFSEEVYDKNSNNKLQTEVAFYAKNFLDEYIETSIKLTLIGSVVFEENNSKELITTTSKTGIITKPVLINGYGNIEVIITQNT